MVSGKEKFKLEELKEAKGTKRHNFFQYITIKYICSKYPSTYLMITLFLKKGLRKCTSNIATTNIKQKQI